MKIKSIHHAVRKETVYDIETPTHDYILDNGIISHNTMELYAKDVVSGGTGIYYSASVILIIGRQQDKEGTELAGFHFILNVEKSRYVKEKSKISISVSFETGIQKYSGILDAATELGFVGKPKMGWYAFVDKKTKEFEEKNYRASDFNKKELANRLLTDPDFQEAIKNKYQVTRTALFQDQDNEDGTTD